MTGARIGLEPLGEDVGPAIVAAMGDAAPVGDRIAEGDDGGGAGRCLDVNSREQIPMLDALGA